MIDWTKAITREQQLAAKRADMRTQIAARRDTAMIAGISIAGMPVATDDVSQGRLAGAALAAVIDPAYTVRWKGRDGVFITLGGQELIGIASAVRAHVQACYDHEADLLAALDRGETPAIDRGWPGQATMLLFHDRADGADHQHTGTGIYRLTGDVAGMAGEFPGPQGLTARAVWIDGALTVWVRNAEGGLTNIPADRWITLMEGI
ncbi:MAG: DUF4376 domain-containing protein [Paracoccus hibiscisoli]|uniref:DUF4376 domain-containing protein n=1 Tax=Paracoccus hibiscisoli TaxID=2023261 RepID=UPI00391C5C43